MHADQRAQLPYIIQHGDTSALCGVGGLVVDGPGYYEGDGGEETGGDGVDEEVAEPDWEAEVRGWGEGEEGVPEGGEEGVGDY